VALGVLITVRNNDLGALLGKLSDEVTTEEAGAAKDSRNLTGNGRATTSGGTGLLDRSGPVGLGLVKDSEVVGRLEAALERGCIHNKQQHHKSQISIRTRVAMRGATEATAFDRRAGAVTRVSIMREGEVAECAYRSERTPWCPFRSPRW
jgi:hypothetical protein